jgi:hypothetical protein
MTITLDLQPEIERGLLAQAQAKGVSLTDYAHEVLARQAKGGGTPTRRRTGQELIDACAGLQGVFTDEEIDDLFRRNASPSRRIDLE